MEQLDEQGNAAVLSLERKSVQPYATQDEYLYAMKEDLAEWLNTLYALAITVDTFFEDLETGNVLCDHANKTQDFISDRVRNDPNLPSDLKHSIKLPERGVQYKSFAQAGSFLARDNISNFISWCRGLGIPDTLLFETEDLVTRKNERNVVLCMLEVARRGARYGMLAPQLIQMEEEIDAELAGEEPPPRPERPPPKPQPPRERWVNDHMTLDEMVRHLVSRCTCPDEFPMIRVAEGKYRIGDSQTLIFVRILRNHVMVRIGGGWDTLENYLNRHDPCRCNNKGHKGSSMQMKRRASAPVAPGLTTMELKTTRSVQQQPADNQTSPRRSGNRQLPQTPDQQSKLVSKTSIRNNNNNHNPEPRRSSIATPGQGSRLHKKFTSSNSIDEEVTQSKTSIPRRPQSAAAGRSYITPPSSERSISPASSSGGSDHTRSSIRSASPGPQRHVRARSVGPTDQSLSKTSPASVMREALKVKPQKEEVLTVKRDSSGGHHVGPVKSGTSSQQPGMGAMGRARMHITPDRLLPDKPIITRSPSMESDSSSSLSDRSATKPRIAKHNRANSVDIDCLSEQTPEEEIEDPPVLARTMPARTRTLSASFSMDSSAIDDLPEPEPNAELNQHMELLFEEYMRIERGSKPSLEQDKKSTTETQKPIPTTSGKKDLSKVKSRLADYINGKKGTPVANGHHNRSMTTTPMGFKRPASASAVTGPRRSSMTTHSRSQSRENILDEPSQSPASQRRRLPATPKSMPASPTTATPARPMSAGARRESNYNQTDSSISRYRPTTPSGNRPTTPSGNRPTTPSGNRPTTPSGNRPTTPSGNRPTTPSGNRPTTPNGTKTINSRAITPSSKTVGAVGHQSRGMVRSQSVGRVQFPKREQSKSREDLLDNDDSNIRGRATVNTKRSGSTGGSAFRPVTPKSQVQQQPVSSTLQNRARPKSAQSAFRKVQSKSREDLLDNSSTKPSGNPPPWRSKTPTPSSNGLSAFRAPSPGRSAFRSPSTERMDATKELHNTIAEIADFVAKLPKDFDHSFDLDLCDSEKPSPLLAAKPRKDKIGTEGPKTKIPMPLSQKDRGEDSTLKRYDSGVDINVTDSPTESSIHEDEHHLPWHQENGLQYARVQNEQEYF